MLIKRVTNRKFFVNAACMQTQKLQNNLLRNKRSEFRSLYLLIMPPAGQFYCVLKYHLDACWLHTRQYTSI